MTEYELMLANHASLKSVYHLLIFVVVIQIASFILSLGKLWMMHNVRDELAAATRESAQYRTLTQQYYDLYTREGRDAQQVILNAAQIVKDTVKSGGPMSDSAPHPVVRKDEEGRSRNP